MNHEFERMWKKAVVACFKVLSQPSPGGTEENHEIPHWVVGVPADIRTDIFRICQLSCSVCTIIKGIKQLRASVKSMDSLSSHGFFMHKQFWLFICGVVSNLQKA
jgi:hypothetical protein